MEYKNLVDVIQQRSVLDNRGITFINGYEKDTFLSYSKLYEDAKGILSWLYMRDIKPGDELILLIDDNMDYIRIFWACILGGIIPVHITTGKSDEYMTQLLKIFNILKSPYLITSKDLLPILEQMVNGRFSEENINIIKEKTLFTEDIKFIKSKDEVFEPELDDIACILFSSGSTGDPKGVIISHENILFEVISSDKRGEINENDKTLCWAPLFFSAGLLLSISSLLEGIDHYIIPTMLFLKKPLLWMSKVNEYRVTQLFSSNFGYKHFLNLFDKNAVYDWDLSCVKYILNGGEPISIQLCNEFLSIMSLYGMKESAMHATYGMAETTTGVAVQYLSDKSVTFNLHRDFLGIGQMIREVEPDDSNGVSFVQIGPVIDCCEIRICDESNNTFEESIIGLIQVKGRNVSKGYYNNPQATNNAFTPDGWLITGDLGFLRNGYVTITGRYKDIIFVNGKNVYPYDLEKIAESVEGIGEGQVAVCCAINKSHGTEKIILFVLFNGNLSEFVSVAIELKKQIHKKTGLEISSIIPIENFPKTISGKIQRYKLSERYNNGEFNSVNQEIDRLTKERFKLISNNI